MGDNIRYALDMLKTNMKAAATMKTTYLIRSIFNITNHTIYLCMWVVIFDRIPSIGGWQVQHIMLAYGVGIFSWGLISFLAFGIRTLPRQIDQGELDTYLTQPKPVLLNIALGTTQAAGPPEMVFGTIVLAIAGYMAGVSLIMLAFLAICCSIVFASLVLAYGSLGFWLKDFHGSAEEIYFNFFIMATRPEAVFSGWMLVIVLTVMPISFMTHIPLHALLDDSLPALVFAIAGTFFCAASAYAIFSAGLKRYESGNRFGVRG